MHKRLRRAPEHRTGRRLGHQDLDHGRSVHCKAVDAVHGGRPESSFIVEFDAVVASDCNIAWAVQASSFPGVRKKGRRVVVLGTADPPQSLPTMRFIE